MQSFECSLTSGLTLSGDAADLRKRVHIDTPGVVAPAGSCPAVSVAEPWCYIHDIVVTLVARNVVGSQKAVRWCQEGSGLGGATQSVSCK